MQLGCIRYHVITGVIKDECSGTPNCYMLFQPKSPTHYAHQTLLFSSMLYPPRERSTQYLPTDHYAHLPTSISSPSHYVCHPHAQSIPPRLLDARDRYIYSSLGNRTFPLILHVLKGKKDEKGKKNQRKKERKNSSGLPSTASLSRSGVQVGL